MGNQVSISNLTFSINNFQMVDGDVSEILSSLYKAKEELNKAKALMETITVKGKEPMNILLGCILAIENMTGDKGE